MRKSPRSTRHNEVVMVGEPHPPAMIQSRVFNGRTHGSLLIAMPTTPTVEGQAPPPSISGVSSERDKVFELSEGHLASITIVM